MLLRGTREHSWKLIVNVESERLFATGGIGACRRGSGWGDTTAETE